MSAESIVSHGKRYRGQHQAAFTREEWTRIQQVSAASVRAQRANRPEAETAVVVPAFADVLVCASCQQRLAPRTGPHHHYYKDVAHACGIPCPAGGYLQVCQEVIAQQFNELLQNLPLALEHTVAPEETPMHQQGVLPCGESSRRTKQGTLIKPPSALQNIEQSASSQQACGNQAPQADAEEACLAARAHLLDIRQAWPAASPARQLAMVTSLFEPGGISYDIEQEQLVALVPRSLFAPWFCAMPGTQLTHTERGTAIFLAPRARQLTRQQRPRKGHLPANKRTNRATNAEDRSSAVPVQIGPPGRSIPHTGQRSPDELSRENPCARLPARIMSPTKPFAECLSHSKHAAWSSRGRGERDDRIGKNRRSRLRAKEQNVIERAKQK